MKTGVLLTSPGTPPISKYNRVHEEARVQNLDDSSNSSESTKSFHAHFPNAFISLYNLPPI